MILATGHSARDVYRMLRDNGYALEMKGIATGVRLEHQSFTIDCIQYHSRNGRGNYLPAAEYSVAAQVEGRGVYSFCMCPGGFVVPAATGDEQIVVNGMSPSNRGSKWSNSGMVVEMRPEDLNDASISALMKTAMGDEKFATSHSDWCNTENPLRMMYFQEALERECWLQGNRKQTAPAQRMGDFVNRKLSFDLPRIVIRPGTHILSPAFLDAGVHLCPTCRGFQNFRGKTQRLSVERSNSYRSGNTDILARENNARQHNAPTRFAPRTIPLRRRRGLCRRNCIGCYRRRTLCTSCGIVHSHSQKPLTAPENAPAKRRTSTFSSNFRQGKKTWFIAKNTRHLF